MRVQQHFFIIILLTILFVQFSKCDRNYTEVVIQILNAVKQNNTQFHHSAYNQLAYWVDTFGSRLWGSQNLEVAIKDLYSYAISQGLENVALEPVQNFTAWWRGMEKLTLYNPRYFPTELKIIGLGNSVSGNVTGDVIVVRSWNELKQVQNIVKGKIVVYNQPWIKYSQSVEYRTNGASQATKYGAIAALIRSATPFSIESPHTGVMSYNPSYPKIPVASITVEDAEMFQRMQDRGQRIVVNLYMENKQFQANSSNLIAELKGSDKSDEIVLISGHMDSWDVGSQTGANDDGGGILTCIEAIRLLKGLGLRPRRTIRVVGWSGEEFGSADNGAQQYIKLHASELGRHVVALEDDYGSTRPYGFGFKGSSEAATIIKNIASQYLYPINCTVIKGGGGGEDVTPLNKVGNIPTMSNLIKDTPTHDFYFTYHHSQGDTMSIMNADDLDDNVVAIAAMSYILADIDQTLPKKNRTPELFSYLRFREKKTRN